MHERCRILGLPKRELSPTGTYFDSTTWDPLVCNGGEQFSCLRGDRVWGKWEIFFPHVQLPKAASGRDLVVFRPDYTACPENPLHHRVGNYFPNITQVILQLATKVFSRVLLLIPYNADT